MKRIDWIMYFVLIAALVVGIIVKLRGNEEDWRHAPKPSGEHLHLTETGPIMGPDPNTGICEACESFEREIAKEQK